MNKTHAQITTAPALVKPGLWARLRRFFKTNGALLLMVLPGCLILFVFSYMPLPGIILAFKNFKAAQGIWGSEWVGLANFEYLFSTGTAWRIIFNTVFINGLFIIANLAASLFIAILLHEIHDHFASPVISSNMWGQVWYPSYYGYDPVDDSIGSGRGGSVIGVKVGDKDRKVVLALDTPEYREALDLAKRWHDKGYFDKDIVPDNDMIAKRGELGYGVFMFPGVGDFSTKAMADTEWKGVPILTKALQPKTLLTTGIGRTGTAVCSTSKNPELATKYIEEVNQNPELYNLLNFGIEGKHWVWKDKDNKVIGLPDGVTMDNATWLPNTYWQFGDRRQLYLTDPTDIGVFDRIDKALADADISPVMGFTFDRKPVENEIAQVNTIAKEYEVLNRGMVGDIDGKLAEYKAKLKEAGIDKIIAEAQRQIDEWAKTLPAQ